MANRIAKGVADRLLQYLREEGIADELPAVTELLQHEVDRRITISVISAAALSEDEQNDLRHTLSQKWGERDIIFTVDPSILSGMIVAFKDQVIDMSGRAALSDLSQKLS